MRQRNKLGETNREIAVTVRGGVYSGMATKDLPTLAGAFVIVRVPGLAVSDFLILSTAVIGKPNVVPVPGLRRIRLMVRAPSAEGLLRIEIVNVWLTWVGVKVKIPDVVV